MKLHNRISLIVLVIFLGGWLTIGISTYVLEMSNARENSIRTARLLLSTADAVSNYTANFIEPVVKNQTTDEFIEETVPSYSAQQVFLLLDPKYRDYQYSEKALNPTNPKDLPTDWQVNVIEYFIDHPEIKEMVDIRVDRDNKEELFVAMPIQIQSPKCLTCHSTPDVAPPTLIKTYGTHNGFGWKLDEVIGAQFVVVPTLVPKKTANNSILSYLLLFASILLLAYSATMVVLRSWVTTPLNSLVNILEEISTKASTVSIRLPEDREDSIGRLNKSINRLINSLNKSLSQK